MRFPPALFFLCIIIGCYSPSNPEIKDHVDSVVDSSKRTDSLVVATKCEFDISKFKKSADSLLGAISHRGDTFRIDIDTAVFSRVDKMNFFYPLYTGKGHCLRYFMEAPKKSSLFRFWLVTGEFPDSASARKAFDELHKRSRDEEPQEELMPGLTYENDYLLLAGRNIYWLNTGCPYGSPTNNILKNAFRASTCEKSYDDSIIVYCGESARN